MVQSRVFQIDFVYSKSITARWEPCCQQQKINMPSVDELSQGWSTLVIYYNRVKVSGGFQKKLSISQQQKKEEHSCLQIQRSLLYIEKGQVHVTEKLSARNLIAVLWIRE